jgi:hypothetical protein
MSQPGHRRPLIGLAISGLVIAGLTGCSTDYLQHSDRIRYGAGNAVRANLEAETVNPAKASMDRTTGLGANGAMITPAGEPVTPAGTGAAGPGPAAGSP